MDETYTIVGEPENWYWHWGHCDQLAPNRGCSLCTGTMLNGLLTEEDMTNLVKQGLYAPQPCLPIFPRF